MAGAEENRLQVEGKDDIMLTSNERRIITNLRHYAESFQNADLACLITVRNGQMMKGLLCLGKGPESNIRL